MRTAWLVLRKDFAIEARSWEVLTTTLFFAVSCVLIFAFAFVFVSVAPVYMVQIAPDFFNFAIVLFAFFFWCYKEVAGPAPEGSERSWRTRWLLSPRSDVVAAALLGVPWLVRRAKRAASVLNPDG